MGKSNRLITLPHETNEKLKGIENASGLISELLDNHFNAEFSNDLDFLTKQLEELDIKIKSLEFTRDSISKRVRLLNEKAINHQEIETARVKIKEKNRELTRWLSEKVNLKEITFDDFRNIKELDNWGDCVESVMNGRLDLGELIKKAQQLKDATETPE